MTVEAMIEMLMSPSPRSEATILTLAQLGGRARTGDIARALGLDRSNMGRILEKLADDGRVILVDDCDNDGRRGRPSRVWEIAS